VAVDIVTTEFAGLFVIRPKRKEDARGFFCEAYQQRRFADAGIETTFVQDNFSLSKSIGTLRGLHYQMEPWAQAKLINVVRGAAQDVVVDLRRTSSTFGKYFSITLDERDGYQLFVPVGFAHGFVTVLPDTLVVYKVSEYYSPQHDTGLRFDDPALGIEWRRPPDGLVMSERDKALPRFNPTTEYFG
jgi:dTDP-4-dehydrorhamnose 3,5-epimerase